MSSIRASSVSKRFRSEGGAEILALSGIDLEVSENEFVAIVGPSGCGKSTFLYMVAGFIPVSEGTIYVNERPVHGPGPDRGIVFQHFALFPWLTVKRNIMYGLEERKTPAAQRERVASELIEMIGLSGFENAYPKQLSGGMRQRVALARTLAFDPDILLMDEPFGALDAQTRAVMQEELLRVWNRRRKTVLFVTHDVHEAVQLADRVVVMSARPGRVKAIVDTSGVRSRDPGGLKESARVADMVNQIWEMLRQEVTATLAAQRTAAPG